MNAAGSQMTTTSAQNATTVKQNLSPPNEDSNVKTEPTSVTLLTRNDARFLLGFIGEGAMEAPALRAIASGQAVVLPAPSAPTSGEAIEGLIRRKLMRAADNGSVILSWEELRLIDDAVARAAPQPPQVEPDCESPTGEVREAARRCADLMCITDPRERVQVVVAYAKGFRVGWNERNAAAPQSGQTPQAPVTPPAPRYDEVYERGMKWLNKPDAPHGDGIGQAPHPLSGYAAEVLQHFHDDEVCLQDLSVNAIAWLRDQAAAPQDASKQGLEEPVLWCMVDKYGRHETIVAYEGSSDLVADWDRAFPSRAPWRHVPLYAAPQSGQTPQAAAPRFRHNKRGTTYEVLGVATLQCSTEPPEEGHGLVVYRGEDGQLWARRHSEFHDGRFELVSAPQAAVVPPPQSGADALDAAFFRYISNQAAYVGSDVNCYFRMSRDELERHIAHSQVAAQEKE